LVGRLQDKNQEKRNNTSHRKTNHLEMAVCHEEQQLAVCRCEWKQVVHLVQACACPGW
jgi:hypothetical protein